MAFSNHDRGISGSFSWSYCRWWAWLCRAPLPYPSSYDGTNEWEWSSAELGLRQSEVFALHERFNTRQIRLQDPWAFHRDVAELAHESDHPDAFYTQLAAQRDLRLAEMAEVWLEVKGLLAGTLGELRAWGPAPSAVRRP
jgi:hypothetical protein